MSYIWFNLVLEALGKKLNFDSISNLYGNSFAKDSSKYIQSAYPLHKGNSGKGTSIADLAGTITVIEKKSDNDGMKAVQAALGDISWAEGLFN